MKNRYVRKTKLTEGEFAKIVVGFITGVTATQTARELAESKTPVSRQSVEKQYLDIGNYLYGKYVRPDFVRFAEGINAPEKIEKVEQVLLELNWQLLRGTLDYATLREKNWHDLADERVRIILKNRWDAFNGFTREKLPIHLGFAYFYLATAHINPLQRWQALLDQLETDPL